VVAREKRGRVVPVCVSERGGEVESGGRVGLDPTDPGLVWAKSIGPAQQTTWSIFILIFIFIFRKIF
jgi:hypothetical protein